MSWEPTRDSEADASSPESILQLLMVPGVGPRIFQALVAHFGSAAAVISASEQRLREVAGVGPGLAGAIVQSKHEIDVAAELERCEKHDIRLVLFADHEFPPALQRIQDPPPLLYVRGRLVPRDELAVAMVGTRHATSYGKRQAEHLAASLARAGFTIVSGLARGIDASAHRAALEAGGRTIAVLGSGLIDVYPPEHRQLAEEIATCGALVSEFSSTSHVSPGVFPRRNRLISGLSLGVIVVEAGTRSGALSTARHAMEQNREVFAVPGPVDSRVSHGSHSLLRDGATLVETADDVFAGLGPLAQQVATDRQTTVRRPSELQLNAQEMQVLQSIEVQATSLDQVVKDTGLPVARVLSTVSVLEMRHLIRRLSGQYVCRL